MVIEKQNMDKVNGLNRHEVRFVCVDDIVFLIEWPYV